MLDIYKLKEYDKFVLKNTVIDNIKYFKKNTFKERRKGYELHTGF